MKFPARSLVLLSNQIPFVTLYPAPAYFQFLSVAYLHFHNLENEPTACWFTARSYMQLLPITKRLGTGFYFFLLLWLFDLNSCERSEEKKFGSFGCWEMAKIRLENRTNLKNRTAFVRCKIIHHVMCLFFSIQLRYGQSIYLKPDQNFNYFLLSAVLRSIRVDCLDRVRETSENAEGIQRDYNDRRAPDAVASLPCTSTCDSTRHTHF